MNSKKEYISITLAYLVVILYVIIDNNLPITIVLIIGLFLFHITVFSQTKKVLSEDKKSSVSKLLSKLDKSKKEQEESYRRFISLSRNLGSGLLMIDEEGTIQLANKDICEYFRRDFNNTDYQDHASIKNLYNFLNQAYLLETTMRKQITHNDKHYDLISTPLYEEGLFKGALILVNDITLLKNAEKYQKRFTADVSHELRTPLSAIKGFSEILSRDKDIDVKDREEFIELIRKESFRMETILNDLLVISKLDRVDYELNLTDTDIKTIVQECTDVLKKSISDKGLKLKVEVDSQIFPMDRVKMSQVILNILKNALSYTDEGEIKILGNTTGNEYTLSITDTGIGIKEENYEKIFKRFYRVDRARSRDSGGSGLGLSISKNVILKHNGQINVSSKLDKGTTFTIKLPIKK